MYKISLPDKNLFFKLIKKELIKELPGIAEQIKMAPSLRKTNNDKNLHKKKLGSILILLYPYNNSIYTVLMKRQKYNGVHSNQISFPGGKYEINDGNLFQTAIRETKEEIGINPETISILGKLTPIYIPISNINVLPVIGKINTKPHFNINKNEVQYLIEVNLNDFFIQTNHSSKTMILDSQEVIVPFYNIKNEHVWGATAMIISEFIEVIRRINQIFL